MSLFTTEDLISRVRLYAFTPAETNVIGDTDILSIATDELQGIVTPFLAAQISSYYQTYTDVAISSSGFKARIPKRAWGGQLQQILILDDSGYTFPIPVSRLQDGTDGTRADAAWISGAYVYLNNDTSWVGKTMRLVYSYLPSQLILESAATTITAVNAGDIEVAGAVSGLTTGIEFDIIEAEPYHPLIGINQTATISGTTFTMTPPSGVSVGDYVALAGESPLVQVPRELWGPLVDRTIAEVLEILGYSRQAMVKRETAKEKLGATMAVTEPRVEAAAESIVQDNEFARGSGRRWTW